MLTYPARLTPPEGADLSLTGVVADGVEVRIAFAGEVDMSTASVFAGAVGDAMLSHPGHRVAVDLAGIRFLDSSGIRALLTSRARADAEGRDFLVVGAQPGVVQVLQITGIYEMLTSAGSPAEKSAASRV